MAEYTFIYKSSYGDRVFPTGGIYDTPEKAEQAFTRRAELTINATKDDYEVVEIVRLKKTIKTVYERVEPCAD